MEKEKTLELGKPIRVLIRALPMKLSAEFRFFFGDARLGLGRL
jgi:hypothetical protein